MHTYMFHHQAPDGTQQMLKFTAPEGTGYEEVARSFLNFLSQVYGYRVDLVDLWNAEYPEMHGTTPKTTQELLDEFGFSGGTSA